MFNLLHSCHVLSDLNDLLMKTTAWPWYLNDFIAQETKRKMTGK